MPSGRWQLSTAVVLLLSGLEDAGASEAESHVERAMMCSLAAATVYAELTEENSETVAKLSYRECEARWKDANLALRSQNIAELEAKLGREFSEEELAQVPLEDVFSQMVLPEIQYRTARWRAAAAAGDSDVYKAARRNLESASKQ